jgi:hypothetical protein
MPFLDAPKAHKSTSDKMIPKVDQQKFKEAPEAK